MTALVVVDVQNDFCEGGALGVSGGERVARDVARLLSGAHGYDHVVATRDRHVDPGDHFSDHPDFVDSWPRHCVVGTSGAELRAELAGVGFDAIVDKGAYEAAYSGFEGADAEGTPLAEWLRARGVRSIDVVGIATDHCVRATVEDGLREGFEVRLMPSLTAAVRPDGVPDLLERLRGLGCTVLA